MKKEFQIELDISAEEAWTAVGEKFGETGQWTSSLDSSHLVGALDNAGSRVCIQGRKKLIEKITKFDPETMVVQYELIDGRPAMVKTALNKWSVKSLGPNRSIVTMNPTTTLKWWAILMTPVLSLGLNSLLPKILEEFRYWVETGEVHPRKKAHDAKLRG